MTPRIDGANPNNEIYKPKPQPVVPPKPPVVANPVMNEADKPLFLKQNSFGADQVRNNLFTQFNANFTPTAPAAPTVDGDKVSSAVSTIKDRLDQGFTDWDVTKGDLNDIRDTVKNLNSGEANEVFRQLSDGNLQDWADELDGANGGYDSGEKKQLFDDLASKLDGQQLARLTNALGDQDNIQSLGDSIANHSSDEVKLDSINRLKEFVGTNEGSAKAVAELIDGLKNNPQALETALRGLSPQQLSDVMKAARQEEIHTTYGGMGSTGSVYTTFEPQPLADMLNAVAGISDPELKARVFNEGALQLKSIEEAGGLLNPNVGGDQSAKTVRDALTTLINSDTNGVVTKLENQNQGEGLSAYVKSMLGTGEKADQDTIGAQTAKLLSGNSTNEDQVRRFEETQPGTLGSAYYQNARTLGFYAGSIHAGVKGITDDRNDQANIIKNVFGTAAGIAGGEFPVAGAIANGLSTATVDAVVKNLNDGSYDLRNSLLELTFPHDSQGRLYRGPAKTEYEAAFAATALRNDN